METKGGNTPLHIAARENKKMKLSRLLAHQQCDPNTRNMEGDTPLHIAVKHEHSEAIDQLLSCKKCKRNAYNKEGDTIATW